jgi:hypothetical protein
MWMARVMLGLRRKPTHLRLRLVRVRLLRSLLLQLHLVAVAMTKH